MKFWRSSCSYWRLLSLWILGVGGERKVGSEPEFRLAKSGSDPNFDPNFLSPRTSLIHFHNFK